MNAQQKLLNNLEKTKEIVKSWPQWKQKVSYSNEKARLNEGLSRTGH